MPQTSTRRLTILAAALAAACLLLVASSALAARYGSRTLRAGMHGSDVTMLQHRLTDVGYRTGADGSFGPGTERSVRRYEASRQLKVNGVVDHAEAMRLDRDARAARAAHSKRSPSSSTGSGTLGSRTLRRGSRGGDVRQLQQLLGELGFYTGVDGDFGPGTEQQVRQYQTSTHQTVNGVVTPAEARDLQRRASASQNSTGNAAPGVFPVRGPHTYGDRFGARGGEHRGQDVPAACGTTLVAAEGGRVIWRGYQSGGAGNYLVIRSATSGRDEVYMHMRSQPLYGNGQTVATGARIGYVGETGDATGCHLHFELWTAPGWYNGGHAIDPLPQLRYWDTHG